MGKKGNFLTWRRCPSLPFFFLAGVGLLLCQAMAVATVGLLPPQASHNAFVAFTTAVAVFWLPAPSVSLMEGSSLIKNIERNRSLLGLTL
jgi:hypothetical protein